MKSTQRQITSFKEDILGSDDAFSLSQRLRHGDVSSEELVQAAIDRIEQVDPTLSAMQAKQYDIAIEQARAFDKQKNRQGFGGLPTLLKDNLDLKGLPTGHGSLGTRRSPEARKSSAFADQMQRTGLIILGKTKMPEFGLTATTEHSSLPPAKNPWNIDHSTGGSSGGSAAMVAAGAVPLAHANDGGGSIRIPAACCGLVGLKPSRGRLAPNELAKGLPINVVSDGVVTRSVRDTARFLTLSEQANAPTRLPAVGSVEGPNKARLKIGYFTHRIDGTQSDPECAAAVADMVEHLNRLGHHLEEIAPPIYRAFDEDFLLYWGMLAASVSKLGRVVVNRHFDADALDPLTKQLSSYFSKNIAKFPFALGRLKRYESEYQRQSKEWDLVLSPVLGHPAPPIGHLAPTIPFEDAKERLFAFASFTAAQNIAGAPAISLPTHISAQGLPIGLHFAGARGTERRLLEIAYEIEATMGLTSLNRPNTELASKVIG